MVNFEEIKLSDRKWIVPLLCGVEVESCDNNFTTLFIWRKAYNTKVSTLCGGKFFSALSQTLENEIPIFTFPYGKGEVKEALDEIINYCDNKNITPVFYSITDKNRLILDELYKGKFSYEEMPDSFDYIYETEKLANLKGKKLAAKRNHINAFLAENKDWKYEEIDKSNIDEAYELSQKWCSLHKCAVGKTAKEDCCAVREAFDSYFDLELSGGLIRTKGEVVAYSMGDYLSDRIFDVHIEKAMPDVRGAYQIINREFVRNCCNQFEFVNREDDAGSENLRKAKLSYHPFKILKKYKAIYNG